MLPTEEKVTRRRKWNDEEDHKLVSLVNTYGFDNWRTISNLMSGRDSKQCRERYINHLDPNVKKGKLSDDEWAILYKAHDELGNKYAFSPNSRALLFCLQPSFPLFKSFDQDGLKSRDCCRGVQPTPSRIVGTRS